MIKETIARAEDYRLNSTATIEELEIKLMHNKGTVLVYGDYILVSGYFYSPNYHHYFAALYKFIGPNHSCEGQAELVDVSDDTFIDDGHAIAWAMSKANV